MTFSRMRKVFCEAVSAPFSSRRQFLACSGATLLLSVGTATAWFAPRHEVGQQPSYNRRLEKARRSVLIDSSSIFLERMSMTRCEEQDVAPESANDANPTNGLSKVVPHPHHHVDSSIYKYIIPPPRALTESHAVLGALLEHQGGGIRSFRVYKNMQQQQDDTDDEVVMAIIELGYNLDGHKGVIHGGILALLIDDTLGYAVIEGLEVPFAVTANLNIDYRAGVPAGSTICIRAKLVERKERKMVWKVIVESCDDEPNDKGAARTLYCEASSVFVIPRDVYAEM